MIEFNPPTPENRQPRCPCVLVLDTSYSMNGEPLAKLNAGIAGLPQDLRSDALASKRVEVAIVGFPPVRTLQDFVTADQFSAPSLKAGGSTPLGAAVLHGLDMIEQRKAFYRDQHLEWFRPWLFLITDGAPDPTDDWRRAAAAAKQAEEMRKVAVFAVAVPGADVGVLAQFSRNKPLTLVDLRFREMFQWLSRSLRTVSRSNAHTGGDPDLPQDLSGFGAWGRP